jgi:hypothetical protein
MSTPAAAAEDQRDAAGRLGDGDALQTVRVRRAVGTEERADFAGADGRGAIGFLLLSDAGVDVAVLAGPPLGELLELFRQRHVRNEGADLLHRRRRDVGGRIRNGGSR